MASAIPSKDFGHRRVRASPFFNKSPDEITNFVNLRKNLMEKLKLKNWFVVRILRRMYIFNLNKKFNGNLSIRNTISIDDELVVKVFSESNDSPLFNLKLYRWSQLQNLIEQLSIDVKRENDVDFERDSTKESVPVAVVKDDKDGRQQEVATFEFCATNVGQLFIDPPQTLPDTLHTLVKVKEQVVPFLKVKIENEFMDPVSPRSTIVHYGPYICTECGKEFDQNARLMLHKRIHIQKICLVCNQTFTGDMNRHMKKHELKEKSHRCHTCGLKYNNQRSLKDHKDLNHIGLDEFFCDICNDGKDFKTRHSIQKHMKREHKPNKQQPPVEHSQIGSTQKIEQKQTREPTSAVNHSDTRQSSKICAACGKEFSSNRNLLGHMRRHNPSNFKQCPICKKRYFELSRHMNSHYKVKNHICDQCGNAYLRSSTLKEHVEMHHSPGEFFCDICNDGRVYLSKFRLRKHLSKHAANIENRRKSSPNKKVRPQNHQCKLCNKEFSSYYALRSHIALEHNESGLEYRCKVCDKTFRMKSSLGAHEKLHTAKSYICNVCGKSFTHTQYLRKHLARHSGRNRKPCTMCDKEYASGVDLRSHMKKVHDVVLKPMSKSV